jgi:hypothetical protein
MRISSESIKTPQVVERQRCHKCQQNRSFREFRTCAQRSMLSQAEHAECTILTKVRLLQMGAGGRAVLQLGPAPLLDNASSLVTRKALGAPAGACPNCWRARVVVDSRTAANLGGAWRVEYNLVFFGPPMLTNLELDGELDVIHERPCEARFQRAVSHYFFRLTLILAL